MPRLKEPHFFLFDGPDRPRFGGPLGAYRAREMVQNWDDYQALFNSASTAQVTGEASTNYLYSDQARIAIDRRLPDCKLVVILRQPADRAYSAYQRNRFQGSEPIADFAATLAEEPRREAEGWHTGILKKKGFYARYLKPYLDTFGRERVRVYLFEDLVAKPEHVMRDLFQYLEIDPDFRPDLSQRFNQTGVIENPLLRMLWNGTRSMRSRLLPYVPLQLRGQLFNLIASKSPRKASKVPLDNTLRAELTEQYRDDILQLQDLIGRDLSHWLSSRG